MKLIEYIEKMNLETENSETNAFCFSNYALFLTNNWLVKFKLFFRNGLSHNLINTAPSPSHLAHKWQFLTESFFMLLYIKESNINCETSSYSCFLEEMNNKENFHHFKLSQQYNKNIIQTWYS